MKRSVIVLLVLFFVAAFGATVWPTVWNERTVAFGGRQYQLRTHRLNSERMEYLTPTGWRPMRQPLQVGESFKPIPCPDVSRQEWDASPFMKIICLQPAE
jgi:hypothetical protein